MEKNDNSPNPDTSAFKKVFPTVIFGIAALFHLLLLAIQLTDLPYDRDEGFYLLACRLVAEGKALYSDFFYPQMPLFPSVYGAILKHTGYTIEAGRLVSLVFYEILCICVGLYVWRRTGRKLMGAVAWGLMAFNTLAIFWFSRVKAFAMCDLLIFISFVFLASHVSVRETSARRKLAYSFFAGLLLAFAFNARLTSLPLFVLDVAFIAWIYRKTPVRAIGQAGAYMGGILTGSLPGIIAILRDWEAFWFNNVGCLKYLRPEVTFAGWFANKTGTLGELIFYPENPVIWVFAIMSALFILRNKESRRSPETLALLRGFFFAAIYLVIQPTWPQYWIEMMPFFISGGSIAMCSMLDRGGMWKKAFAALMVLIVLSGSYRAVGRWAYKHRNQTLRGLSHLNGLTDPLKDLMEKYPGEVFAAWPGYLTAAGAIPVDDFEFGGQALRISDHLPPEMAARYHLMTTVRAVELIKSGHFPIAVDGSDMPAELSRLFDSYFILIGDYGGIRLYLRKSRANTNTGIPKAE